MVGVRIFTVELYLKVRRAHFQDGLSGRRIARSFGISRDSVRKMLSYPEPLGYRRTADIKRPKLDAYTDQIDHWLTEDEGRPRKQRHTAKRIFERLCYECGFGGGYLCGCARIVDLKPFLLPQSWHLCVPQP